MRRAGRRTAAVLGALLAAYLLAAALGGLVPGPVARIAPTGGPPVEIGLIHGPIHVDLPLPATPATRAALGFAREAGVPVDAPGTAHLLVGWGARDFYTSTPTWSDLRPGPVLRAVTGDAAVLRVDAVGPIDPAFAYPRLALDPAAYAALLGAIRATAAGGPVPGGFTPTDGFHEARGRFHLLSTCNTWVGRMLRDAGEPAGLWTPTPYALRLSALRAGWRTLP